MNIEKMVDILMGDLANEYSHMHFYMQAATNIKGSPTGCGCCRVKGIGSGRRRLRAPSGAVCQLAASALPCPACTAHTPLASLPPFLQASLAPSVRMYPQAAALVAPATAQHCYCMHLHTPHLAGAPEGGRPPRACS